MPLERAPVDAELAARPLADTAELEAESAEACGPDIEPGAAGALAAALPTAALLGGA